MRHAALRGLLLMGVYISLVAAGGGEAAAVDAPTKGDTLGDGNGSAGASEANTAKETMDRAGGDATKLARLKAGMRAAVEVRHTPTPHHHWPS